jgi:glutamate racemase
VARGVDTLILGCTHYPFLAPLIREVVGDHVMLIDTGAAVARHLMHRVRAELPPRVNGEASETFFTSGDADQASRIMSLLWGKEVVAQQLPEEFL